jgi:hypothetical protein
MLREASREPRARHVALPIIPWLLLADDEATALVRYRAGPVVHVACVAVEKATGALDERQVTRAEQNHTCAKT